LLRRRGHESEARFAASAKKNLAGENTTRTCTVAPHVQLVAALAKIAREATALQVFFP
jgi:hypothetical protein